MKKKELLDSPRTGVVTVPCPRFVEGELYLFRSAPAPCAAEDCLWGIFDKRIDDRIYLESSSRNLYAFRKWHTLPAGYCYCRRASRSELRDYIAGLVFSECRN